MIPLCANHSAASVEHERMLLMLKSSKQSQDDEDVSTKRNLSDNDVGCHPSTGAVVL